MELDDELREQLRQTMIQMLNFMSEKANVLFSTATYVAASPSCMCAPLLFFYDFFYMLQTINSFLQTSNKSASSSLASK